MPATLNKFVGSCVVAHTSWGPNPGPETREFFETSKQGSSSAAREGEGNADADQIIDGANLKRELLESWNK